MTAQDITRYGQRLLDRAARAREQGDWDINLMCRREYYTLTQLLVERYYG